MQSNHSQSISICGHKRPVCCSPPHPSPRASSRTELMDSSCVCPSVFENTATENTAKWVRGLLYVYCASSTERANRTKPKYQIFKSKLLRNPWEYWILYCYIRLWNGKFSVMRSIIKFLQNLTSLAVYESPMIAFFESWVTFIFFSLGHLYSESSVKYE